MKNGVKIIQAVAYNGACTVEYFPFYNWDSFVVGTFLNWNDFFQIMTGIAKVWPN